MIGVKRSDSLAIRAVFWSLIAVIFVSIGFSATQVYLEFQDEREADRLALAQAVSASKPALVNAAYQLDSVLAQQLIKGLLMNEIVDAARLEDDSGAVLASGSNPALDETMPLVSLLIEKRKTVAAIPLFKDALDTSADSAEFYGTLHLSIEPRRGMQSFSERNRAISLALDSKNHATGRCFNIRFAATNNFASSTSYCRHSELVRARVACPKTGGS